MTVKYFKIRFHCRNVPRCLTEICIDELRSSKYKEGTFYAQSDRASYPEVPPVGDSKTASLG